MACRPAAAAALAAGLGLTLLAACAPKPFRISGSVTLAADLHSRAPRQGAVLFIVAENLGGVPLAVLRVVDPGFPVNFVLGPEDLLVSGGRPPGPFRLVVKLSPRSVAGPPARGDLVGADPDLVYSEGRSAHVVINRRL
ncbi:MAG: hypothetical protein KGO96_04240 [Elusimicrobia bacterium]|nr:hypothetical protein [Elusimicrobiota bacterium]MDE2238030.1 hypothetical protein [Elusimicrobiota bacterium]MDE2425103.1 hypothetical protein [Elusimicrobiota bacterium]